MRETRICRRYCGLLWVCAAWAALVTTISAPGQTLDAFNPNANSPGWTMAVQPDGKILIGGNFWTIGGKYRSHIARLNPDGTLDNAFNPGADLTPLAFLVQADGKILVGGAFFQIGGQARACIARLNRDGSVDNTFNPGANDVIEAFALQPDGKILVGGAFTSIAGTPCHRLARLNPDGTLDSTLASVDSSPGTSSCHVYSIQVQADGKIVVAGDFSLLGGMDRSCIGRLNPDGSVDTTFNPGAAGGRIQCLAMQPDGRLVVGGTFTTLAGQPCNRIGRLTPAGLLDTAFGSGADSSVYSLALQADGKVLLGGSFSTLDGEYHPWIGRFRADGTPDSTFTAYPSSSVFSLALQTNGAILLTGYFTSLNGEVRNRVARLENTDAATQSITYDAGRITWLRAGTSPEVLSTRFEISTDQTNWSTLGNGTRVTGGWQCAFPGLPTQTTYLRGWGLLSGGYHSGSQSFVTADLEIPARTIPRILPDNTLGFVAKQFGFNVTSGTGDTVVIEASTNLLDWTALATNVVGGAPLNFRDPNSASLPGRFYRVRPQ